MAKYKIEFNPDTCVGSLFCLQEAEELFGEDENGYTILKNATRNKSTGMDEVIIDDTRYEKARKAAEECPTLSIKVTKIAD
ncbi:MAG: hypothetical protein KatS3mg031_1816 [Chitinophagales bacterium]|nr:MAG: hypothetical protein KatS3mg031_1816 [Chitinophagales bacterium]